MRVLITGVNGFIGRHTAMAFRSAGAEVTGADRQETAAVSGINYVQADLTEENAPKILAEHGPYDSVVHLAAGLRMSDPEMLRLNPLCALRALQAAVLSNSVSFLHLSSIPVIGRPPADAPLTEDLKTSPRTLYHISKLAAEQVVMLPEFDALKRYNVRIASPVGPGMPPSYLKRMLTSAAAGEPLTVYGRGTRVQCYIDARDVARALEQIAAKKPEPGCYLLGGTSISNLDAANLCAELAGRGSEVVMAHQPDEADEERWLVDCAKAERNFGFERKLSLEQSLRDVLEADI